MCPLSFTKNIFPVVESQKHLIFSQVESGICYDVRRIGKTFHAFKGGMLFLIFLKNLELNLM